jgi:virginiamycin B lyase
MMTNKILANGSLARLLAPLAFVALFGASGCTGPGGLSTPSTGSNLAGSPAIAGKTLSFKVFTAGQTPGFPAGGFAEDIAVGPGGDIWFTDGGTPAIGRISPAGKLTEYTAGLPAGARPFSIVPGPDGNMWFSDYRGVAIGRVTPKGAIVEYSNAKFTDASAAGVAFDAQGEPWFVALGPKPLLGHLTAQGKIAITHLPLDLSPDGTLASDSSGNLWFIIIDKKQKAILVERTPQGQLTKAPLHMYKQFLPCCPHAAPKSMAIGPDGHLWFTTLQYGHKTTGGEYIGTMTGGGVQLFKVSDQGLSHAAYPAGLATTSDALWFTGGNPFDPNGGLWRMDTQGNQTVYDIPYNPIGLTVDAAGNPWFTASFNSIPSQIVKATIH